MALGVLGPASTGGGRVRRTEGSRAGGFSRSAVGPSSGGRTWVTRMLGSHLLLQLSELLDW